MRKMNMDFIPDAKMGNWEVSTVEVPEDSISEMISKIKTGRGVPGGTYKYLKHNNETVMSNTPNELMDFYHLVRAANGSVLINGLGLGCLVNALLLKEEIVKVVVIEKNIEVIELVGTYFKDERLTIIHEDAFKYTPKKGEKYDFVWHDIWNYITSDNLEEMNILHKKYKKFTRFQDSWERKTCLRLRRSESQLY